MASGGVGDEGNGFIPCGDGLENFDNAAAFGLAHVLFRQAADNVFKTALVLRCQHFQYLAGIFFPMIDATWFVVRLKVFAWFDPFLESESEHEFADKGGRPITAAGIQTDNAV